MGRRRLVALRQRLDRHHPAGLLGRARDPELLGAARALGEW
ncbi:hypothetical protein ACFQ60_23510 [Streptomyces zhihengii]